MIRARNDDIHLFDQGIGGASLFTGGCGLVSLTGGLSLRDPDPASEFSKRFQNSTMEENGNNNNQRNIFNGIKGRLDGLVAVKRYLLHFNSWCRVPGESSSESEHRD